MSAEENYGGAEEIAMIDKGDNVRAKGLCKETMAR